MIRWFTKEVLPLLIVIAIVLTLTLVPYFSTENQLHSDKKVQTYLCKFSAVMREFALEAANARFTTAQHQQNNPALQKNNFHAARVYLHVRNELKTLPPDHTCLDLTKGGK